MRIVAALATLVKHLPPGSATRPGTRRQARTGARTALPQVGWAAHPRRHRLLLARVSSGNTFRHAFYRGLTLPCMEGYDPVHIAVISFRTGRK